MMIPTKTSSDCKCWPPVDEAVIALTVSATLIIISAEVSAETNLFGTVVLWAVGNEAKFVCLCTCYRVKTGLE